MNSPHCSLSRHLRCANIGSYFERNKCQNVIWSDFANEFISICTIRYLERKIESLLDIDPVGFVLLGVVSVGASESQDLVDSPGL